jgi:hypothetical protein
MTAEEQEPQPPRPEAAAHAAALLFPDDEAIQQLAAMPDLPPEHLVPLVEAVLDIRSSRNP